MKALFFLFFITSVHASIELKFIGPCADEFIFKTQVKEDFATVGDLTVETLKKFSAPYKGSPEGLSSVFNTPTGEAAIERISANEYRAHGWCFAVNNVAPDLYPHQVPITPETKSITWTFGFARNVNGKWVTQCTPTHTVRPKFLCQDPTAEQ